MRLADAHYRSHRGQHACAMLLAALAYCCAFAFAMTSVELPAQETRFLGPVEGRGVPLSPGIRAYPSIGVGVIFNDNFFSSSSDEESAETYVIRPGLGFTFRGSRLDANASVVVEAGRSNTDNDDDYIDHEFNSSAIGVLHSRHRIFGSLRRTDDHDPLGDRRTETTTSIQGQDLDKFFENDIEVGYRYGAERARINLEFAYRLLNKEYTSNRAQTQFLDFDRDVARAALRYRFNRNTQAFVAAEKRDIDFDAVAVGAIDRSSEETFISTGVEGKLGRRTTGRFEIGHLNRDLQDANQRDFSGVNWRAQVLWQPTARDNLQLRTERASRESFINNANFIDVQDTQLQYRRRLNARMDGTLDLRYQVEDFDGNIREDERTDFGAGLIFRLPRRGWNVLANYNRGHRTSSLANRDFTTNTVFLGLEYRP